MLHTKTEENQEMNKKKQKIMQRRPIKGPTENLALFFFTLSCSLIFSEQRLAVRYYVPCHRELLREKHNKNVMWYPYPCHIAYHVATAIERLRCFCFFCLYSFWFYTLAVKRTKKNTVYGFPNIRSFFGFCSSTLHSNYMRCWRCVAGIKQKYSMNVENTMDTNTLRTQNTREKKEQ